MTEEPKTPFVRPSWDEYFMGLAKAAASRATCDRGRSGCCIARDKRILVTGYVGSPMNCAHCDEAGHEIHTVRHADGHETQHCIRTTHAEQNAICQAALLGISLKGGTLYARMTPCYVCAKMIINCGIVRVVCENDYHDGQRSKEIFQESGVAYILLNQETVKYDKM
ncbi:MAG: cytidine/deoxycytidylate deaminase family protein [Patescibacteria group bacterium]|jgi:dCMP deaminase